MCVCVVGALNPKGRKWVECRLTLTSASWLRLQCDQLLQLLPPCLPCHDGDGFHSQMVIQNNPFFPEASLGRRVPTAPRKITDRVKTLWRHQLNSSPCNPVLIPTGRRLEVRAACAPRLSATLCYPMDIMYKMQIQRHFLRSYSELTAGQRCGPSECRSLCSYTHTVQLHACEGQMFPADAFWVR